MKFFILEQNFFILGTTGWLILIPVPLFSVLARRSLGLAWPDRYFLQGVYRLQYKRALILQAINAL